MRWGGLKECHHVILWLWSLVPLLPTPGLCLNLDANHSTLCAVTFCYSPPFPPCRGNSSANDSRTSAWKSQRKTNSSFIFVKACHQTVLISAEFSRRNGFLCQRWWYTASFTFTTFLCLKFEITVCFLSVPKLLRGNMKYFRYFARGRRGNGSLL
jgi:hypothetical protein